MASRLFLSSIRRSPLAPSVTAVHAPGLRRYVFIPPYDLYGGTIGTKWYPLFAASAFMVYQAYVYHSVWLGWCQEEAEKSKIIEANNLKIETLRAARNPQAKGKPDANGNK